MYDKNRQLEHLAKGNLVKLLFSYSWPSLVGMSLNALYSVIDRLYIGQGCGEAAMAGLQLSIPVMLFFTALGIFIGLGHATLLSIQLGANKLDDCKEILGEMVFMKIVFSLVLPTLAFFNLDTVLHWCGGAKVSAEAYQCARTYLKIVLFSQCFSHLAFGLSSAMRAEGSVIKSMMCLVVGFGVNLVLDPILIFGFRFSCLGHVWQIPAIGVAGAAWATNIAMILSAIYAFSYQWSGKAVVPLKLSCCRPYRKWIGRTSAIGFSPFLQNLLSSLIVVTIANTLGKWSPDAETTTRQIASLGVFNSALIFTFTPICGAQQGLQPIFGYNWGARNYRRVLELLKIGFWTTTALCVLAFIAQAVPPFPRLIARIFVSSENKALIDTAEYDLIIANCMVWCISFNVLATTFYQAIGKPMAATLLSTLRQGVLLIPCILLLPHFMENHMLAIWLALPISDVGCQLCTIPFLWQSVNKLRRLSRVNRRHNHKAHS